MMNMDDLFARLLADETHDAVVVRIGEADYGCEDCAENAPAKVWVLLLRRDGTEKSLEIPESRLTALQLDEGSLCCENNL